MSCLNLVSDLLQLLQFKSYKRLKFGLVFRPSRVAVVVVEVVVVEVVELVVVEVVVVVAAVVVVVVGTKRCHSQGNNG